MSGSDPEAEPASAAEAALGQVDHRTVRERHQAAIDEGYGRLRSWFKRHPERFADYRRRLNQARFATTYDVYLARSVRLAGLAALIVALAGAALGVVATTVADAPVATVVVTTLGPAALGGAAVGVARYYWPGLVVRQRRADIERELPHGVAYLYALSHGGLEIVDAIEALADSGEEYGALAEEFDTVVRDIRYFGADPLTAVRSLRSRTPSPMFADFLDDLASTIEAGGNVTQFLMAAADEEFERETTAQSEYLDQVGLYAELYVGALVVGPIFAIIVLLMLALAGGGGVRIFAATVYVGIPFATLLFMWLLVRLNRGFGDETQRQRTPRELTAPPTDDPRLQAYLNERRQDRLQRVLAAPGQWLLDRPRRTLLFTVPVALAVVGGVLLSGLVTPSRAAMVASPLLVTSAVAVLPAAVVLLPFATVHEVRRRRSKAITKRFPDLLRQLSAANERGLTLPEALGVVARRTGGPLGAELRRTANDIQWGAGLSEALDGLRDRVRVDAVSRTLALLADASRYSSNLHRVIDVAARDTTNARQLVEQRRSETSVYITIVLVSFFMYLLMIVVVDSVFLERVADVPAVEIPEGFSGPDIVGDLDLALYRTMLLHGALIQSLTTGLVAGELGEDSWVSGLKYSTVLVALTLGTFLLTGVVL